MERFTTVLFALILTTLIGTANGQSVSIIATNFCENEPAQLVGTLSIHDSLAVSWLWDLDNNGIYGDDAGQIISVEFLDPGLQTIGLQTITQANETLTVSREVRVHPKPLASFVADNLCEETTVTFSDASTLASGSIVQWAWTILEDSGNVISSQNATYQFGDPGQKGIRLVVTSDSGCTGSVERAIEVFPQPTADFTSTIGCLDQPVQFSDQTTLTGDQIEVYTWNFGDGSPLVGGADATYAYQSLGSFDVTLIARTTNGCADTATQPITVNSVPDLFWDHPDDLTLFPGTTVTLQVDGDINDLLWSDNMTTSPTLSVSTPGVYSVSSTSNGCVTTLSQEVVLENVVDPLISSSILTPNADGHNDVFEIVNLEAYQSCQCNVFNRWGDEVFSSANYQNEFDGTSGGNMLDAGAYIYYLKCDDQPEVKGVINLLGR